MHDLPRNKNDIKHRTFAYTHIIHINYMHAFSIRLVYIMQVKRIKILQMIHITLGKELQSVTEFGMLIIESLASLDFM